LVLAVVVIIMLLSSNCVSHMGGRGEGVTASAGCDAGSPFNLKGRGIGCGEGYRAASWAPKREGVAVTPQTAGIKAALAAENSAQLQRDLECASANKPDDSDPWGWMNSEVHSAAQGRPEGFRMKKEGLSNKLTKAMSGL
jgi:hypothetical protein